MFSTFDRYVIRHCLISTFGFLLVLTCTAYLTQSVRVIDAIAAFDDPLPVFGWLALLLIPAILSHSLPLAGFVGALHVLFRLHGDSEIAAIYAAGSGPRRLLRPIAAFGLIIALLAAPITLLAAPYARAQSAELLNLFGTNLTSRFLRPGKFTTSNNSTVYVRSLDENDTANHIFIYQELGPQESVVYAARDGSLDFRDGLYELVLNFGVIHGLNAGTGDESLLRFDKWSYRLGEQKAVPDRFPRPWEMFVTDLLDPDLELPDESQRPIYLVEAHDQITLPVYGLVLPIMALAGLLAGRARDTISPLRVTLTAAAGIALLLAFFMSKSQVNTSLDWLYALYVLPAAAGLGSVLALYRDGRSASYRVAP